MEHPNNMDENWGYPHDSGNLQIFGIKGDGMTLADVLFNIYIYI